jgi:hypothetical protein
MVDEQMTDIICPLCGKPNPPELDECKYCQAPLKTGGFIAPPTGDDEIFKVFSAPLEEIKTEEPPAAPASASNLEDAIPDWLKETEANFLEPSEPKPSEVEPEEYTPDELSAQIDSLINPAQPPPEAKDNQIDDEWLASLLAEAGVNETAQPETHEEYPEEQALEDFQESAKPFAEESA